MGANVFETVKQSVTVREAAERYGIEVKRGGMACCPFHDDKNPSMKLNEEYFYCFGCGATGDVIDLTARLYNLSPKEAAEKLAQDFGLIYDSQAPPRRRYVRQKTEAQKFQENRDHAFRVLADYFHLLRKWEAGYTPKTPEEPMHPRFLEAVQQKDYIGYLLDSFLEDSPEEQKLWIAEHQSTIANLERRVNIMADKPTNRERLQEITAGIEQGIKELFESEKYMRYLSVMSKFHRYSVNNTMLIYMQKPEATLVAGFNKWKNQFARHVKKGEHGITIIAPTPYKKKIEEMKRDPDTHAPILDADGKAVMEEKEIEIPMFRPVKVFDVSQTDGKPLPELSSSLSGTVPHYEAFLEALRRSAPVPIEFEPMAANTDGYFSPDQQRIAIREGMSEVQTVSATVHEIAHSKLHNRQKMQETAAAGDNAPDQPKPKDRRTEEVEAESISYAVCQYFGIQTGENSFGYIASWSKGKELKELRASLETINKTSCELINDIERHYKEICKERGIDLTAKQEPEQADIPQEALFLLNDATYLHIQPCDTGWDYTLYDKETMKELDGGQLDAPKLSRSAAVRQICEGLELENPSIQDAPLSMIETLQDAACQQMQEQVSQQSAETAATQLPDTQEQALDEYPMPDSEVSVSDMQEYGYFYDGMLPVTRERALELDAAGLTVYILHEDNTESMVFDTEEIMEHGGLFGVEHEEWEQSPQFHEKVLERQDRQLEREQAFLSHEGSCFAIYQVSRDDPQNVRFMNLDWLQSHNLAVDRSNYDLIYTAPLNGSGSTIEQLETLYEQFNLKKPVDFHSPSLSVSDIVAIKQDGKVSCHYCDSVGFTEIPGFLPDNPLKNAEMMLEDDYGMIDGIINNGPKEPTVAQLEQQARSGQPISLMDLAEAVHREERDKKKSVMEQLKSQPRTEHKKTAPKKSAEREL
ncbi:YodL domain-containing protein [[Clostridium] innocuum]|uniref:YodL domain-containing protein n=1 Tax=Clostridium innocuum TaxID=1522 RepID=UPI001F58CD43|nr:LPD16 domain-containing protein [[Clostridium] innocuum]MCI3026039.1 YodL domain-containing protein [[Clostridium] innocuum]